MTCCNPLSQTIFATGWVNGECRQVLKRTTTDPDTAAITVTYLDPSVVPPALITDVVEPGPCRVGDEKEVPRDVEFVVVCDPDDNQVLVQFNAKKVPPQVMSATVLTTGAPYTGPMDVLAVCGGKGTEADPRTMCDQGTTFIRFFVMEDGEPTGVVFDRTLNGTPYTVTDEAGLKVGNCAPVVTQSMSSTSAQAFTGPVECTSFAVSKPDCCELTIMTSVGEIVLPAGVTSYATQVYKDPFTVTVVTATGVGCDPAEVSLTFNRS